MANAISCHQLPINPARMHFSLVNGRLKLEDRITCRYFILEVDGDDITVDTHKLMNKVHFKGHNPWNKMRISFGKRSICITNDTDTVSFSGVPDDQMDVFNDMKKLLQPFM